MYNELRLLIAFGGEGIGLFRTEYLFLAHEAFPPEEKQFLSIKALSKNSMVQFAVIPHFDLGGDKIWTFPPQSV